MINLDAFTDIEVEEIEGVLYNLMENERGNYLIQKINETDDGHTIITFANITNNPTITTMDAAWTNKSTLTYDIWDKVF